MFSLTCNQFKLTEQSTGESLKNFEIKEKDLIIADRAYGTVTSTGHCLKGGGDFIIRIKNKPFNMYDGQGKKILLSDWLKTLGSEAGEISVYIKSSDKKLVPLRICARKKTEEEIAIGEKRLKRLESKRQITYSDDTKFTHQFMFVITSIPASVSAEKVLEFYRLRWQVELVFKRYKPLPGLGNMPAKTKESSGVWLNGKMFLALLIEKYLGDIDFPPPGTSGQRRCVWKEMKLVSFLIYIMLLPDKETIFSHDFLELSKNAFIEKRKKNRQQLCQFP